jgi:hypothetical protein
MFEQVRSAVESAPRFPFRLSILLDKRGNFDTDHQFVLLFTPIMTRGIPFLQENKSSSDNSVPHVRSGETETSAATMGIMRASPCLMLLTLRLEKLCTKHHLLVNRRIFLSFLQLVAKHYKDKLLAMIVDNTKIHHSQLI